MITTFCLHYLDMRLCAIWCPHASSVLCIFPHAWACMFDIESDCMTSAVFIEVPLSCRSRDSAVGVATRYRLEDWGVVVQVPVGSRIFSTSSRPAVGPTQPPIKWVPGALSSGIKWQGREADHSPPTSAQVKKMWIHPPTPQYAFIA
jgi:hypothetical protein